MPASVKLMIAVNAFFFIVTAAFALWTGQFGVWNIAFDAIWLAVIYGLIAHSRLSWQLVRAASLLTVFASIFGLLVAGAHPLGRAVCAVWLVLSIACFHATGLLTARECFHLRCPTCTRMTATVRITTGHLEDALRTYLK